MKKQYVILKIIIAISVVVLLVAVSQLAYKTTKENSSKCVVPTAKMYLNTPNSVVNLCEGKYKLDKYGISFNATNITLNCNGAEIYNTADPVHTVGIDIPKGHNNKVLNCKVTGYSIGIAATNYRINPVELQRNLLISGNTLRNNGGVAQIFLDGVTESIIENNKIYDAGNLAQGSIGSHCIYYSQDGRVAGDSRNSIIRGNYCYNSSASGIKFNCRVTTHVGFEVYNNKIEYLHLEPKSVHSTDAFGLALFGIRDFKIHDNYINDTDFAILIGQCKEDPAKPIDSINNYIYDNTLINSYSRFNGLMSLRNGSYNTYFYNNNIEIVGNIQSYPDTSFYYKDNTGRIVITDKSANPLVDFNYTGRKNFFFYKYSINITEQAKAYPYNDILLKGKLDIYNFNNAYYKVEKNLWSISYLTVGNFTNKEPKNNTVQYIIVIATAFVVSILLIYWRKK